MDDEIVAVVILLFMTVILAATVLVPVVVVGGVAWLVWYSSDLMARVKALETRVATLQAPQPATPPAAPLRVGLPPPPVYDEITEEVTEAETVEADFEPLEPSSPVVPPPVAPPPVAPPPVRPPRKPPFELPSPERVIVWFAAAAGGTTIVLAVLLGLAVVIERGWLGPAPRVALGLTGGTVLWGIGLGVRRPIPVVGSALSGVAIGILYGTLFAAHGLYELLPSTPTTIAMIAVTAVATLTAARDGDRFTAHLALIGGLLTPVLVSSGENRPIALFSYLAVLVGGVLLAARRRGWWDVALVAAAGVAALHIGWSVTWYAADQAPAGLVGAFLLTVPFAIAASAKDLPLRIVGFACAVGVPLVATPWLIPVDPVFMDPMSYLVVVQPLSGAAWWVAGALSVLFAPAWIASRGHEHPVGSALAGVLAAVLVGFAGIAWVVQDMPPIAPLAAFAVGPLAVGVIVLARSKSAAPGVFAVPVATGVGLGALAVAMPGESAAAVGLGASALVLLGWLGSLSRSGIVLWPTVAGVALALGFAAPWFEAPDRAWVTGPALLALGVLGALPLARKWPGDARGPWIASALVWPAMFPALYVLWKEGIGPEITGALPLLLGSGALLGALTLRRREHVDRGNLALAAFVAVALLGAVGSVAVQLEEGWLTIAWALEAAALALLARWMPHPFVRWGAVLLGVTVAVRLLVNPWALGYGDAAGWPIVNWTLYTWGIPFVALLILANGLWDPLESTCRHASLSIL